MIFLGKGVLPPETLKSYNSVSLDQKGSEFMHI